jgi:NADH-quinone oxidoreductase subunit J
MEFVLFFLTAAIALFGSIAMLMSRKAVHSVLYLLLNFGAIAVLYLLLYAPFIFAIQLAVYAGAIMVLFLFVVMLLGSERSEETVERMVWQRWLALALALVLLVEAVVVSTMTTTTRQPPDAEVFATTTNIGQLLFTTYLLPVQVTGIILLVAIVGVVVLSQRSRLKDAAAGQADQPS